MKSLRIILPAAIVIMFVLGCDFKGEPKSDFNLNGALICKKYETARTRLTSEAVYELYYSRSKRGTDGKFISITMHKDFAEPFDEIIYNPSNHSYSINMQTRCKLTNY